MRNQTKNYLSEIALAEMDLEFRRLMRRRDQLHFEGRLAPPPVIGSDYVPPDLRAIVGIQIELPGEKRDGHRYWPTSVVLAFWNAPVIRRTREGK